MVLTYNRDLINREVRFDWVEIWPALFGCAGSRKSSLVRCSCAFRLRSHKVDEFGFFSRMCFRCGAVRTPKTVDRKTLCALCVGRIALAVARCKV